MESAPGRPRGGPGCPASRSWSPLGTPTTTTSSPRRMSGRTGVLQRVPVGRVLALLVIAVVCGCNRVAAAEISDESSLESSLVATESSTPTSAQNSSSHENVEEAEAEARGAASDSGKLALGALGAGTSPLVRMLLGRGLEVAKGLGLARGYKKMAQTILPLLVGFKATGLLVIAMAVTKAILLKALFLSTTALAIAALLALKKFLSASGAGAGSGAGGQPHDHESHAHSHAYTYSHHDLAHVPYLAHPGPEYVAHATAAEPQVTYIGGSYGVQHIPYAGASAAAEDAQGLYTHTSQQGVSPSALTASQLQQLQEHHQALLAQQLQLQLAANNTAHSQAQVQLSGYNRRRIAAAAAATAAALPTNSNSVSSPYPYRIARPA